MSSFFGPSIWSWDPAHVKPFFSMLYVGAEPRCDTVYFLSRGPRAPLTAAATLAPPATSRLLWPQCPLLWVGNAEDATREGAPGHQRRRGGLTVTMISKVEQQQVEAPGGWRGRRRGEVEEPRRAGRRGGVRRASAGRGRARAWRETPGRWTSGTRASRQASDGWRGTRRGQVEEPRQGGAGQGRRSGMVRGGGGGAGGARCASAGR
jgi:hypothetical protein